MSVRLISFVLMIFTAQLNAEVREIKSIEEIGEVLNDPHTLVVFDIDNTVIKPIGSWGSDQCYYFLVDYLKERYQISEQEAHHQAEKIWNMAQWDIRTMAVEAMTAPLITKLQGNKTHVFALTARTYSIADVTRKQLLDNAIDFTLSAPPSAGTLRVNASAVYEQGILYQGEGNDKGQTLVDFIKLMDLKPRKIIFIDDKEKNTHNVHKALEELGIEHIEFRYGQTDRSVQEFNDLVKAQKFAEAMRVDA